MHSPHCGRPARLLRQRDPSGFNRRPRWTGLHQGTGAPSRRGAPENRTGACVSRRLGNHAQTWTRVLRSFPGTISCSDRPSLSSRGILPQRTPGMYAGRYAGVGDFFKTTRNPPGTSPGFLSGTNDLGDNHALHRPGSADGQIRRHRSKRPGQSRPAGVAPVSSPRLPTACTETVASDGTR